MSNNRRAPAPDCHRPARLLSAVAFRLYRSTMDTRLNYSGFVIAGVGFFLTRFTVTLAIYDDPVRFYLAGVVPLALGLTVDYFWMPAPDEVELPETAR